MQRDPFWNIVDDLGIRYKRLAQHMGYSREYVLAVKAGKYPVSAEFCRRAVEVLSRFGVHKSDAELFFSAREESKAVVS